MTLAFGATATVGGFRYATHLCELRLTLGLAPAAGSALLSLPVSVAVDANVEDAVSVELLGENGSVEVFGGVVERIELGLERTTVTATDALGRLAQVRPGQTYEQQSVGSVIRALAAEAGIDVGVVQDGPSLLIYVADQGRTALEHAARLAAWAGGYAVGEADGSLAVRALPSGPADKALRYGREITSLEVRNLTPRPDLVWTGFGPAGNVSAPTAHWQTRKPLPESAPAPAARTLRKAASALRTPAAANDAIASFAQRNASLGATITAWLQPEIRPGSMLEIADAPMAQARGPWFVTSVVHTLGPGPRGATRLSAEALVSGGGLLDRLTSAVGGLL